MGTLHGSTCWRLFLPKPVVDPSFSCASQAQGERCVIGSLNEEVVSKCIAMVVEHVHGLGRRCSRYGADSRATSRCSKRVENTSKLVIFILRRRGTGGGGLRHCLLGGAPKICRMFS